MANVGSMTALVCLLTTYCGCEQPVVDLIKLLQYRLQVLDVHEVLMDVTFGTDCVATGVG